MPNYNETAIIGSQYQRARLIQINNELGKVPTITFCEELVTILENKTIHGDVSQLTSEFDANGSITLVNVDTDIPTGETVTHAKLKEILYSLYKQLASERDSLNQL